MKKRLFSRIRTLPLYLTVMVMLVASVPGVTLAQDGVPLPTGNEREATTSVGGIYTNTWAVQLAAGADINSITSRAGVEYIYPIGSSGWYLVRAAGSTGRNDAMTSRLLSTAGVVQAVQQVTLERTTRDPVDPLFPDQWHLINTGQAGGTPGNDANVKPAWDAGYTGEGIVVASVDDGVWINHPDLAPNVRTDLSYDFLNNDDDPSANWHGTGVAGVMAAAANPDDTNPLYCGVGAAYDAKIAGLYILDDGLTDAIEAASLSYFPNDIHIYNNSWGPTDNGHVLEAPGALAKAAIQNGALNGRNGLGSIYVWAAGNGGLTDNVNADGYANSIYTIAVGASTNLGIRSYYSEPGAAMLVTAPSDGGTAGITTTDYWNGYDCWDDFGGTSSASPLAAGVIALMLEANPNLTWRDVQHLLVQNAEKIDAAHADWQTNGAGYEFNHYYGFGRIDAEALVTAATSWETIPAQVSYTSAVTNVGSAIPQDAGAPLTSVINVPDNFVVEHAEIIVNATHLTRGQIHINLTSPEGTVSKMIFGRPDTGDHYTNWRMMTVANWGELSAGDWTLSVWDNFTDGTTGTFNNWQLIVWGYEEGGEETPTATATEGTPVETPTATATEGTPVETPTATEGTELVVNGGFENDLTGWTAKNLTKDKVVTNKENKTFSHTGDKAFRFKGVPGEKAKLVQKPDASTLAAGDTVTLSAWFQTKKITVPGKVALAKIVYSDASKVKLELELTGPVESYTVFDDSTVLTDTVTKVKVQIRYRGTSGKLLVDDVSVVQVSPSVADFALPLP